MTIRSQITSNIIRSYLFMAGFCLLLVLFVYVSSQALGYGDAFLGIALGISFVSAWVSYFYSDSIILSMAGARPAERKQDFDFYTVTENLSIAAGIPMPRLYVIEDRAMNAFATGRDPKHAVVCATTGLLDRLERRELEGVIAHELSHIKNYDIRFMAIVAVLAGTVAYISDFFLRTVWFGDRDRNNDKNTNTLFLILGIAFAILMPLSATLIKLAMSRKREYLADASGALLTRYPEGLARALEKLGKDTAVMHHASHATAHLFITDPYKKRSVSSWFTSLFDTHPPIAERIRILRTM